MDSAVLGEPAAEAVSSKFVELHRCKSSGLKTTRRKQAGEVGSERNTLLLLSCLSIIIAASIVISCPTGVSANKANNSRPQQQSHRDKSAQQLEAELNSIVQEYGVAEDNNKLLSEAIISRLMLDNLTGSNSFTGELVDLSDESVVAEQSPMVASDLELATLSQDYQQQDQQQQQQQPQQPQQQAQLSGPEAMRLKKLLSALQSYEGGASNLGLTYPIMPATMKRANKLGSYLQQQQRAAQGYGRQNFDFGLGKRPDSGVSSGILRFGDLGSQAQPVGQFGKRPSAHRYDFGLGKRVASPAYPRFDFGLGKRAPNRIRYDFGLGK